MRSLTVQSTLQLLTVVTALTIVCISSSAAIPQGKGGEVITKPATATKKTAPPRRSSSRKTPSGTTGAKPKTENKPIINASAAETAFWNLIKDSTKPEDFRSYLNAYPKGQFVDLANERIKTLEAEAAEAEAAKNDAAKKEVERINNEAAEVKRKEDLVREGELRGAVKSAVNDYEKINAHRNLGNFLSGQKRYAEAETELREAVRRDSQWNIQVWRDLVNIYREQKKYAEAESEIKTFINLKPSDASRHSELAHFFYGTEQWQKAEVAFRDLLQRYKPNEQAYSSAVQYLVWALERQRKYAEVEAAWRDLVRVKPDAENYAKLGQFLASRRRWAESEAEYREAIRLKPDSSSHRHNLGVALWKQRKFSEAETAFRDALRLHTSYDSSVLNSLGKLLIRQDRYSEAVAVWRAAIARWATESYIRMHFVWFLVGEKKWSEAEAETKDLLRSQPTDHNALYVLSMALANQNKLAEAETAIREALRLKPDGSNFQSQFEHILEKQNKWAELETISRRLIQSNPNEPWHRAGLVMTFIKQKKWAEADAEMKALARKDSEGCHDGIAQLYEAYDRLAEAETHYRRAAQLCDPLSNAQISFARFLVRQKKWKEAEAVLREAVRRATLYPGSYHYELGRVLADQNRWQEAETEIREAIRTAPHLENSLAYINELGRVLKNLNRPAEAEKEFKTAEDIAREKLLDSPGWAHGLLELARALEGQNRLTEAKAAYALAEAAYKEAVRSDPLSLEYRQDLQRATEALRKIG